MAITWDVADADGPQTLSLLWQEYGGPPVAPPLRKGFGSRLIERSLAGELDARVRLTYEPEGVQCRIDAPLGVRAPQDLR